MRFSNIQAVTITLALGLFSACSKDSDKSADSPAPQANAPTEEQIALSKEHSQLPAAVVIRVPVDAAGNEVNDKAEMRTAAVGKEVTVDNTEALFATAQAARVVSSADELDADSSTQSWQNPSIGQNDGFDGNYNAINIDDITNSNVNINVNNGNGNNSNQGAGYGQTQGGGYGQNQGPIYGNNHGGGFGQGGFGQGGCNGSSWCGYNPRSYSLVHTSSYWAFPRPRCYGFGGYNYYWYQRPNCGRGCNTRF